MRLLLKYLITVSFVLFACYIYLNSSKPYEIDSNGIDLMEQGDNPTVSQQADPDFKPVSQYHSGKQDKVFSHHNKHKKMHQVKHIAFEATLALPVELPVTTIYNNSDVFPQDKTYSYLYFKEINPPPPKSC